MSDTATPAPAPVPAVAPQYPVDEVHRLLDEALAKLQEIVGDKVPEKVAQVVHHLTGAHGAVDQVSDSASKE